MKYTILIMSTPEANSLSGPDLQAWESEIMAWYEEQGKIGKLADFGHQLQPADTARTVRASGVTDGPFAETKEVVGGYSVIEAATIGEAVNVAKTWPGVDRGWVTIEVRPVVER
jgi:hypothetical protein